MKIDKANIKKIGGGLFIVTIKKDSSHKEAISVRNHIRKYVSPNQKFFIVPEDIKIEEAITKSEVEKAINQDENKEQNYPIRHINENSRDFCHRVKLFERGRIKEELGVK